MPRWAYRHPLVNRDGQVVGLARDCRGVRGGAVCGSHHLREIHAPDVTELQSHHAIRGRHALCLPE